MKTADQVKDVSVILQLIVFDNIWSAVHFRDKFAPNIVFLFKSQLVSSGHK